jgi:signal transduction histidine kinase
MDDLPDAPAAHGYPIPANEPARQRVLDALRLRDRRDDPFFRHVVSLAQAIFDVPIAFVGLIDGTEQRFLCVDGLDIEGTSRDEAVCAHTVAERRSIVLGDMRDDPRFRDNPLTSPPLNLRFVASAPVILSSGFCPGTVCAIDVVPHETPGPDQVGQLEALAAMVARFYELSLAGSPADAAEVEAAAREAQDAFLELIGHEMRTPLHGILGLVDCLTPPAAEDREVVAALRQTATHLDAIVGRILDFTHLRSGEIVLSEAPCDIHALIRRAADATGGPMRLRGKTLAVEIGPDPLLVAGDEAMLGLALVCLLDNVLAHGGTEARIRAEAAPDGGVIVTIEDDGPGIDGDRIEAIWAAFEVGRDMHQRTADGLGLGLPLTRRITELHGGAVALHPLRPGLRATLRLPAWRRRPTRA